MRILTKSFTAALILCVVAAAQGNGPERNVAKNVLTSEHDPKVQITLPSDVQYAGADRFVLYHVADCELHAFVEADANKNVKRLYWIQFEGYIRSRPELAHTYDSPRHTTISGMDFYVDTWVQANDVNVTPGSDLEHINQIIRAKGFKLPAGMMSVRLVHLLDESKRQELMIIYSEDVASTGFAAPDLRRDGRAHDHWSEIERALIERAQHAISLK